MYVRNSQRIHDLRIFRHDVSCVPLRCFIVTVKMSTLVNSLKCGEKWIYSTIWNTVFEFPEHSVHRRRRPRMTRDREVQKNSYRSYVVFEREAREYHFLIHLLRRLARVTYTTNESYPYHSIVSLTRNNTTRIIHSNTNARTQVRKNCDSIVL